MKNNDFELPYFGKKETFKSLKINDYNYEVAYYGDKKSDVTVHFYDKTSQNLINILNSYYHDLETYLARKKAKYKKYENDKRVREYEYNFTGMGFLGLLSLGCYASLISGAITSNIIMIIIGLLTFIPATISITAVIKGLIDFTFFCKALNFMNEYDECNKKFAEFNEKMRKYEQLKQKKEIQNNEKDKHKTITPINHNEDNDLKYYIPKRKIKEKTNK